jgi:hypothetical protein
MNDELNALRSFRPEATGPTDALQLKERIAFMESIARTPNGAPRRLPRLRPRRRVLLGVAIALVAAVGTAGATGIIPDDVQQALGLATAREMSPSLTPQIDQAAERASAPTADGGTLELWIAPTNGGGTCAYLRRLDAAGAPTDSGPISCAVSIAGGGEMGQTFGQARSPQAGGTTMVGGRVGTGSVSAQVEVDASGNATVFGHEPSSVAKVEVVDSSGAVLDSAATNDGWFLLTLPAGAASAAASLAAESTSGASVGTVPITTAVPPPPTTGAGTGGSTSGTTSG